MIRRSGIAICLALGTLTAGTMAHADCALIERLDKLHIIQSRLARDPDTALFSNDIRQIRHINKGIGNRATLDAVEGNGFTGHGADFLRFLAGTQLLLQRASLDDPQSVRPHFDSRQRETLRRIGRHLVNLRCNTDQIAVDATIASERGSGGSSDAEDLAEVAESLNRLADEVFRPRTLLVMLLAAGGTAIAAPIMKRGIRRRRRRARRHNTTFATQYLSDAQNLEGMLIDINCHGTKLRHQTDRPLPKGQPVEIAIFDQWIEGTVMWSNAHYSGVQFRKSLSLSDVDAVCAAASVPETQNGAPRDAASQNLT